MTKAEIQAHISHLSGGVDPQTVERVLMATEHFVQVYGGGKFGSIMALYQSWKKG